MKQISNVLDLNRLKVVAEVKRGGIYTSWQAEAFAIADKLNIKLEPKDKGRWLRVFKQARVLKRKSGNLNSAISFLSDHPRLMTSAEKMQYFFWIYEKGLTGFENR